MDPAQLQPGSRLDRYELLCPLAYGGMASVWLARFGGRRGFERLVVVKMILPQYASDPRFQEMFVDEARIASRIEHGNVARILDVGEQDDNATYIVMEWVDGDSLSKMARAAEQKKQRIPAGIALRICADAAAGLHAAHVLTARDGVPLGVVHRDVSPQNILVSNAGATLIIDFGVAKARDRVSQDTSAGQLKGKIRYMAPEQALGRELDRRADVWALGSILYELFAGVSPYDAPNEVATLHKLTSGVGPAPLPAHVPEPVRAVVERSLAYDPQCHLPRVESRPRVRHDRDRRADVGGGGRALRRAAPRRAKACPKARRRCRTRSGACARCFRPRQHADLPRHPRREQRARCDSGTADHGALRGSAPLLSRATVRAERAGKASIRAVPRLARFRHAWLGLARAARLGPAPVDGIWRVPERRELGDAGLGRDGVPARCPRAQATLFDGSRPRVVVDRRPHWRHPDPLAGAHPARTDRDRRRFGARGRHRAADRRACHRATRRRARTRGSDCSRTAVAGHRRSPGPSDPCPSASGLERRATHRDRGLAACGRPWWASELAPRRGASANAARESAASVCSAARHQARSRILMGSHRPVLSGTLLALALVGLAPRASADPSLSDRETARSLMDDGDAKRDKGDVKAALKSYEAADAIMHVPTTGLEVARAQAQLGLLLEARETLGRVLRLPARPGEPAPFTAARKSAEQLHGELAARIPSVTIAVTNADPDTTAQVVFDGEPVPAAASQAPRKVNPGRHTVVVRAGAIERKEDVVVAERDARTVTVYLKQPLPAAPPLPAEPPPAAAPLALPKVLIVGGFGVAAVGIGVGAVTGVMSFAKVNSVKKDYCVDTRCRPGSESELASARSLGTVSTVAFIAGGVGVAAGVVGVVLYGKQRGAAAPGTRVQLALAGPGWLGVRGTF